MTEEEFVLATLAGCTEYKSILDVVVNAFYVQDGRYCPISERNLYIGKLFLQYHMCLPQNCKRYNFTSVRLCTLGALSLCLVQWDLFQCLNECEVQNLKLLFSLKSYKYSMEF